MLETIWLFYHDKKNDDNPKNNVGTYKMMDKAKLPPYQKIDRLQLVLCCAINIKFD